MCIYVCESVSLWVCLCVMSIRVCVHLSGNVCVYVCVYTSYWVCLYLICA